MKKVSLLCIIELHLIDGIMFTETNIWLKDYYISRIIQNFVTTHTGFIETQANSENSPSPMLKKITELIKFPVLDILKANENYDIMNILADMI